MLRIILTMIFITTELNSELVDVRTKHNYIVEYHKTQSLDGYYPKLIRIIYDDPTTKIRDRNRFTNCLVLISHDYTDLAKLVQYKNSLAYQLAETGCDIWLGPSRNKAKDFNLKSIFSLEFWQFDFYQNELNDLKAITDYILYQTKQKSFHYVGFSNTYSTLTILSLMFPEYKKKYKTIQMLDPIVQHEDIIFSFENLYKLFEGQPNIFVKLMNCDTLRLNKPILSKICNVSFIRPICAGLLQLNQEYNQIENNHTSNSDLLKQTTDFVQEYYVGNVVQYTKPNGAHEISKKVNEPVLAYHQNDNSFSAIEKNIDQINLILNNLENRARNSLRNKIFQKNVVNYNEHMFYRIVNAITNYS